ncbi:MAG: hypothetical protein LBC93_02635 [Synergistaceae bacterium]|nr:hypothetical protein [Synergistaceae bacterium]
MSKLRQGVLRTVRLLPEAVKIGVASEPALPSSQEEEQLLNGDAGANTQPTQTPERAADLAKIEELNGQVAELETRLAGALAERQGFVAQLTSLETEMASIRNAAAQKEREMTASIGTAKEQARVDGAAQGHEEGLKSGYEAGLSKARTEVEAEYREKFSALAAKLEGIALKLEENFAELVMLNQPRMVRLWQEMLKKMLQRETTLSPDGVLAVLADVLSRLSDKNYVLIYVSPDDLELVRDRMAGEFGDILRGVKHLALKPDASVDRGSCIVETNLGIYDARWRVQLEQIEGAVEKLFQKLGKAPEPSETRKAAKKVSEAANA